MHPWLPSPSVRAPPQGQAEAPAVPLRLASPLGAPPPQQCMESHSAWDSETRDGLLLLLPGSSPAAAALPSAASSSLSEPRNEVGAYISPSPVAWGNAGVPASMLDWLPPVLRGVVNPTVPRAQRWLMEIDAPIDGECDRHCCMCFLPSLLVVYTVVGNLVSTTSQHGASMDAGAPGGCGCGC